LLFFHVADKILLGFASGGPEAKISVWQTKNLVWQKL
jgi:hypothetical protein